MINWKLPLEIETQVAKIMTLQEIRGILFDKEKAEVCVTDLEDKRKYLYKEIRPLLNKNLIICETKLQKDIEFNGFQFKKGEYNYVKKIFNKKDGRYNHSIVSHFNGTIHDIHRVGGPFSRIRWDEPEIGKRQKLCKQLLLCGWKPEEFTEKGSPKLTIRGKPVETLYKIDGGLGKNLALWYTYKHRQSQIEGWIRSVRSSGRLCASADTCGTNTARMRHRIVVNVPKATEKTIYGREMRGLFVASPGYRMVGHDASGLEARMEAHYTFPYDDGEYANEILHGDIHTKNSEIFQVDRDIAKNAKYALTYGAQIKKLAKVLECSQRDSKQFFNEFWKKNVSLGKLREKVMKIAEKKGYLPGLDGRKIYIRSSHSALNALFQSAGAIIMKKSMILLDDSIKEHGIRSYKVLDMHDEAQHEVPREDIELLNFLVEEDSEKYREHYKNKIWTPIKIDGNYFILGWCQHGELAVKSIIDSGTFFNLRCPLDAEYKIGRSWAETH